MTARVGSIDIGLTADLRKLQAGFQQGSKSVDRFADRTDRRLATTERRMAGFGLAAGKMRTGLAAGLTGALGAVGLGAGLGVAGVFTAVQSSIRDLANTAAEARRSGLGAEVFQELAYAAGQSRVSVDAMIDGMKELQLRADEFIVTGKGPAAEAFARIGLSPEELKTRLKDPADLLNEIINRLHELDTAAQIRIADEIFGGTGGEQFVRYINQGIDGIARLRKEARDSGAVLDAELLQRAEEIDRQFQKIVTTVGTKLKGAIVEVIDGVGTLIERMRDLENQTDRGVLQGQLTTLNAERDVLNAERDRLSRAVRGPDGRMDPVAERGLAAIERRIQEIDRQYNAVLNRIGQVNQTSPQASSGAAPSEPSEYRSGNAVSDATSTLKAFEREVEAIRKRTDALRLEAAVFGQNALEAEKARAAHALLNAAQEDGIAITPELTAKVDRLAGAYALASAQLDETVDRQVLLDDAIANVREIGRGALGSFVDDLRRGESATDALARALDRVADRLIDIALNSIFDGAGGGGIGSIIGSLFGGGSATAPAPINGGLFAKGGISNRPAIFGEGRLPEAAVPLPDGRRIPVEMRMPNIRPAFGAGSAATLIADQSVHIHPPAGVQTETRQRPGGGTDVMQRFVENVASKSMASGRLGRATQQTFHARRRTNG